MWSPAMFIRKTSPTCLIRSAFSSERTNPEPSSSTCRFGLLSTSKMSAAEASMFRWTVILWDSVMECPYPPGLDAPRSVGAELHRRPVEGVVLLIHVDGGGDRKSTRLNSSHMSISYAVFCLKKKKKNT